MKKKLRNYLFKMKRIESIFFLRERAPRFYKRAPLFDKRALRQSRALDGDVIPP